MTDKTTLIIGTILDEDVSFTLTELCRSFGVETEDLISMVREGLLQPRGNEPEQWVFPAPVVRRLRTALWLQRELEVNLPGAALALDLLDEVRRLRARIRLLEYQYENEGRP